MWDGFSYKVDVFIKFMMENLDFYKYVSMCYCVRVDFIEIFVLVDIIFCGINVFGGVVIN